MYLWLCICDYICVCVYICIWVYMLIIIYIYAYRYVDSQVYIIFHRFLVIREKTVDKIQSKMFLEVKKMGIRELLILSSSQRNMLWVRGLQKTLQVLINSINNKKYIITHTVPLATNQQVGLLGSVQNNNWVVRNLSQI